MKKIESLKKELNEINAKIDELMETTGLNALYKKRRELEYAIERERILEWNKQCKERIKKGMKVVLIGGSFNELYLLVDCSERGIVLRKNKKTATIKWTEGKYYLGTTTKRLYTEIKPYKLYAEEERNRRQKNGR